jgi:hypothetical protein
MPTNRRFPPRRVEIGYYVVVEGSVVLTNEQGKPVGGDGTKRHLGPNDDARIQACLMLRQRTPLNSKVALIQRPDQLWEKLERSLRVCCFRFPETAVDKGASAWRWHRSDQYFISRDGWFCAHSIWRSLGGASLIPRRGAALFSRRLPRSPEE